MRSDSLKKIDANNISTQNLIEKVRAESKQWITEEKDRIMVEVQDLLVKVDSKIEDLDRKTKKKATSI
jgi:hypothetical protein